MVAHDRVHICTRSYTTGYIYVLCRIRQGTYMYSVVYDWVHICTRSYTTGYIYVRGRIRLGTYMYSVCTSRYMYVPTRSTYGEVDPFCIIYPWNSSYPTLLLSANKSMSLHVPGLFWYVFYKWYLVYSHSYHRYSPYFDCEKYV